jgi:hypothetical protein
MKKKVGHIIIFPPKSSRQKKEEKNQTNYNSPHFITHSTIELMPLTIMNPNHPPGHTSAAAHTHTHTHSKINP